MFDQLDDNERPAPRPAPRTTPSRRLRRTWLVAASAGLTMLALAGAPASTYAAQHASATHLASVSTAKASATKCSRSCMTRIVDKILKSMVWHDPDIVPLADEYQATENSHPAALPMMTLWRTVTGLGLTSSGDPDLLAIDTVNSSAYFALDINEGKKSKKSVLWGRIKVVDKQVTELELYVNRSRGDHGFSFSASELSKNYKQWMSPPKGREKASRADLESLSEATFDPSSSFDVDVASDCQFTEVGWHVVDPGPDGTGTTEPLGCNWPTGRPHDDNARTDLVIDKKLGIVVTGAIIPGKVYGYGTDSAFIPDDMTEAQEAEQEWIDNKVAEGGTPVLQPTAASGETLQVLQYYNGKLQGQQINLYLSGPDMQSAWTQ
ncbi:MAG: hypothetical protein QM638_01765 [Nocardioides sp.]|uniref:hypothetical protein n=1 Tax=Nocardioides sp. TaxID=35761 RepID=UPI0039E4AA47